MLKNSIVLACIAILGATEIAAGQVGDAVSAVFDDAGVTATFVLAKSDGTILRTYNAERAATRFSPASTFKIPNTLIGLNAGVVDSAESSFLWDGEDRGIAAWNKDMALRTAYQVSCVWCYQVIARQVGDATYRSVLQDIEYGNGNIGTSVDEFWLNGDLQISAMEQIEFLRKLVANELGFEQIHVAIVKDIMVDQDCDTYTLRAKSGWTGPEMHIGWFVGYVETADATYLFAMNLDMHKVEQAPLRKELTLKALAALQIV